MEQIREELGLNKPVLQQYVDYMLALLHGDMGTSYTTSKPVADEILARMPTTFILAFAGVFVAVLIGIPLGIISATKQYSVLDYISTLLALGGVAMPNFWLGLMLILLFSLKLGWLPSGGGDSWTAYVLPAITLGVGATASFMPVSYTHLAERSCYLLFRRRNEYALAVCYRETSHLSRSMQTFVEIAQRLYHVENEQ